MSGNMWRKILGFVLITFPSVRARLDDSQVVSRFVIAATKADGIGPSQSKVAAFLCMKEDELMFLIKYASLNQILISVKNPLQGFDDEIFARDFDGHRNYYLLDVNCPGAVDVLRKANSTGMFIAPKKWLLLEDLRREENVTISNTTRDTLLYDLFQTLSVYPDSDVVIGQRVGVDSVRLISIYKPSPVGELVVEDLGNWKDGEGISLTSTKVSSIRRRDLRRTPLKSSLVITHPDSVNHLTDLYDRHIDSITKVNYELVLHLVEMMNATVNFTTVNTWGYRDPNGTWSGMIGMLDRKEIDIGGTATFFTPERTDVIQYVSLYTPTGVKFIFRRPPLSYVSNIFVLPFRPTVWLASGVFLILVAGLLHVAWKWEWHTTSKEEREKPFWSGNVVPISWSDNILIMIGAVSQQGSTFEPRRVSPRIILLMLFVAVLSLYTSYTANIVALLQSSTDSINTLEKLLHSPLKIGVHDIVYNRHYFAAFQDPVRKAIYEKKVAPPGQKPAWISIEEGITKLRGGLFAFHVETEAAYKLIQDTFQEDEKCGFDEIDYLQVIDPLLAIQKQSPYLEIVKVGLLKIRESGLHARQISRWYTKKPVCHGNPNFVSVGLIDCYAAFTTLAWGAMLTLIVLFLEVIHHSQMTKITRCIKK